MLRIKIDHHDDLHSQHMQDTKANQPDQIDQCETTDQLAPAKSDVSGQDKSVPGPDEEAVLVKHDQNCQQHSNGGCVMPESSHGSAVLCEVYKYYT